MNILWLSANIFGHELLREATTLASPAISGILTLSDGSGTRMYDGLEAEAWKEFGIPIHTIRRIEDEEALIRRLVPDMIVMAGWRQIIPAHILALAPRGVVGFHPTLLPKGRGPAPIINSILEGVTHSGVTMFYVDGGTDTGDIIGQERFTIDTGDYAQDVYEKVITAGKRLVTEYLPQLAAGAAPRVPQDEKDATHFKLRTLKDNEILPTDTYEVQCRKVRALSHPYEGAYRMNDGEKRVIWKIEELAIYA